MILKLVNKLILLPPTIPKIKNVTILYHGSTWANKLLQKNQTGHDARRDWLQNDIPAAVGIFNNVSCKFTKIQSNN